MAEIFKKIFRNKQKFQHINEENKFREFELCLTYYPFMFPVCSHHFAYIPVIIIWWYYQYNSSVPFVSEVIMMDTSIEFFLFLRHYFQLGFKTTETDCRIHEVKWNNIYLPWFNYFKDLVLLLEIQLSQWQSVMLLSNIRDWLVG